MNNNHISRLLRTMPAVLLYRLGIAMLVYTLCRVLFCIYNADLLQFSGNAAIYDVFRGGLMFDLSGILYVNLLVILLHLLPVPGKYHPKYQKATNVSYWLFNILALLTNLADVVYFRFTGKRTTLAVFDEFANENAFGFLRFFVDYWPVTLAGIGLIALWVWLYRLVKPADEAYCSGWRYYLYTSLCLLVMTPFLIAGIRGGFTKTIRPIGPNQSSLYVERSEQRAAVLNTPFVIIRLIDKPRLPEFRFMPQEQAESLYSALRDKPQTTEWTGRFRGRNVVFIIWESFAREWVGTLNKDIAGYKGYTPFIDSLLKDAYYFERAYAGGIKSIEAMPALFAGVPPPGLPFVSSPYSGNTLNGLPAVLRAVGYDSRFYHNAPNGSMGFDAMARQLGFASYRGMTEFNNDDEFDGTWGIWDEPFLQFVANDLDTMQEPFIASEFTTTSHSPFKIPEKYHSRFPEGAHPQHRCIPYTDYSLEQFFRTARTKPWYNNTLFVIVADHSIPGHLEEYKNTLGTHAIPIIFYDPRGELKGVESERVVQQADMLPTILDLLGVQKPVVAFGHNMFAPEEEHFAVLHMGTVYQLIKGDWAIEYDGEKVHSLYHVKSDPMLKKNLANERPEVIAELLPRLQAYMQDFSRRMRENKLYHQ